MTIGDTNKAGSQQAPQSKPATAIHLGFDYLDNKQLVATYILPVASQVAPKLYTAPPVVRDVLTAITEDIREACWRAGSGDATIRELDFGAIIDQHITQQQTEAAPVGHFTGEFAGCGDILEFVVRAHGALPPAGALIYTQPPAPAQPKAATVTQAPAEQRLAALAAAVTLDQQHEPGPIIQQFGYQPLFNAISSAVQWREGRTIEISVLDFQEALLAATQKGDA